MHKMAFEFKDNRFIPALDKIFADVNLHRESGTGETFVYSGSNPEQDYANMHLAMFGIDDIMDADTSFISACTKWLWWKFDDANNLHSEEDVLEQVKEEYGV